MSNIWKNYDEIRQSTKGKKIILWGRSEDWTAKTLSRIPDLKVDYIIDRSDIFNGTKFLGYNVYTPSKLDKEDKNSIFIIITASSYKSIELSLSEFRLKPDLHYCCSPEYKDWSLLQEIKDYDTDLLISCHDNTLEEGGRRFSTMGGGLYLFNTKSHKLENKKQGHFRQIVEVDNLYYVVEYVEKLLYVFDKQFNICNKIELDQSGDKNQKPNYCGVAYHNKSNQLFVSNAGADTISIYNKESLELKKVIHISQKTKEVGGGLHHINDLTIVDDSLLISCFSVTGSWKKGILDGGIFEYDINNLDNSPSVLMNNLWKPHSVEFYNNSVAYVDSMRGYLFSGNQKIIGKFNGFIRGLVFDGTYYFVGQSEDMYMTELFGVKENIMLNAGVYLYKAESRVSRFYSFPSLSNIHDVKIHKN
jgi:hypothetical protein